MGSLPLVVNVWMACWVTAEEFVTAESEFETLSLSVKLGE